MRAALSQAGARHTTGAGGGGGLDERIIGGSPPDLTSRFSPARVSIGDDGVATLPAGLDAVRPCHHPVHRLLYTAVHDLCVSDASLLGLLCAQSFWPGTLLISMTHSACRAHSGSAQHLQQPPQGLDPELSPKDIGPFGKRTIFSRATKNKLRDSGAQATRAKEQDSAEAQLLSSDKGNGDDQPSTGGKGISTTVESCIVILTAIAMGGATIAWAKRRLLNVPLRCP